VSENGWDEMKKLVEYRLDKLDGKMDQAAEERAEVRKELGQLKVEVARKGGLWGAISAAVVATVAFLGKYLFSS